MTIHHLKPIEREVIKLSNHISKRAKKLIEVGRLNPEHEQVSESCQKLISQIYSHAAAREEILQKREKIRKLVQDNATCPKCTKNSHLKLVGTATHEKGWKSNKYKCRRCNIQFTWNRPNNPWDLVVFMQHYAEELQATSANPEMPGEVRRQSEEAIAQLNQNISQLQPVLFQSDQETEELNQRDQEMNHMLSGIKTYLQIEKIKLDSSPME